MNELASLAVAVFKFTARYSETKMSSARSRVGPIRTVREKKVSPSAVLPRLSSARPESPGSRKRKTAAVPVEEEILERTEGCAASCGLENRGPPSGACAAEAPLQQLATDADIDELSDGSERGPKGKLQLLFEKDAVMLQSNRSGAAAGGSPAVHSQSLSCHAALESCEGLLTRGYSVGAAPPTVDNPRLERVRHRRRVVEECLEDDCRTSVEACLAQCTPLFRNGGLNDGSSHLDPLDGVVFHKFMVNSRGDLFDYDLQSSQPEPTGSPCVRGDFPGADYSGLTKKQKQQDDTRPSALGLDAFAEEHENSARCWEGQVKALAEECQLLRVEREVAVERWKEVCHDLNQALDAVRTLRMAVDSLMGEKLRGSSRRSRPCSSKPAKGSCQVGISQRTYKPRDSSTSFDALAPSGRLKEAEALESRLEKLRGVKTSVVDSHPSRSKLPSSQVMQVKSEDKLEVTSTSSTLSLVNTVLSPWLRRDHSDTETHCVEDAKKMDGEVTMESDVSTYWSPKSGQSNQEILAAPGKPVQPDARGNSGGPVEDTSSRKLAVAAIRGIVEQFQAEDELWSDVQEVLHHVSTDMENLFVACGQWEDRALHAEAQSRSLGNKATEWQSKAELAEQQVCDLQCCINYLRASASHASQCLVKAEMAEQKVGDMQSTMQDLRRIGDRVVEWQTRAEAAEQKVLVLESDMSHLRATLEQVKGRHAIEQSRLLEAGTRLRRTGAPPPSNSTESSKSGCSVIPEQESEVIGPVKTLSKASSPTEGNRSGYDMGLDKGTSRHRRGAGVHRELHVVELAQYILPRLEVENPPLPINLDCVDAEATTVEVAQWRIGDGGIHAGHPKLRCPSSRVRSARKGMDRNLAGTSSTATAFKSAEVDFDPRQMRQLRCPPRPVSSPKVASKPKKAGLDSIISYSGPMRQCSLDLVKRADASASSDQRGSDRNRCSTGIPRARRISREEGSAGLRRLDRPGSQRVTRKQNQESRSWDADEDRSEFASLYSSTDSDSFGTFGSADHEYTGWTFEMLDKWKETASKELSKVRRQCQVPPDHQGQQHGCTGGRDSEATAWRHHMSVRKTADMRAEEVTMKAHLSADKVKAAIPTFQSLFPSKLRKKSGAKVTAQKGRNMEEDLAGYNCIAGYDFGGSQGHETQQGERDSSVQKSRGSFFNGFQKQFLVRNSPRHMKQMAPDRSLENKFNSQELEHKSLRDKKSEGSFLEDIRRHLTGKSPLHPGKDRSRAGSPFPKDHQMHSVMSSPAASRQPLTEIMGNASEVPGGRAFYSG